MRLAGGSAGGGRAAAGYWPAQAVANASLGGDGVIDLATAFACGPLLGSSGWDEEACRAAGLAPAQLPRVAFFGEAVGELKGVPGVPGDLAVPGQSGTGSLPR